MFPNKTWSLGGLKALMKKLTTQVLLFDALGSGRPRIVRTVSVLSSFFISAFSSSRPQFLLGSSLSNRFAPYFLLSRKDLIKYLSSVIIPIIDVLTLHCVSKNVPPLTCYNLHIPNPIRPTTIFGRRVTRKVRNQIMLYFPTLLT